MIVDVYDAIDRMLWAITFWITIGVLLSLAAVAAVVHACRALRKRLTGPSWAHMGLRARILAARRTRAADGRTEPPDYQEAA